MRQIHDKMPKVVLTIIHALHTSFFLISFPFLCLLIFIETLSLFVYDVIPSVLSPSGLTSLSFFPLTLCAITLSLFFYFLYSLFLAVSLLSYCLCFHHSLSLLCPTTHCLFFVPLLTVSSFSPPPRRW